MRAHRSPSRPGRRASLLTLLAALAAGACSDSSTPQQPTELDPGDRFQEVYPGQVGDLSVRSLNHRAVALEWTEVDDGKGSPAQYQVRLVAQAAAGSWEGAETVRDGTCGYPLRGASVGARVECVITGLEPDRPYAFLVRAERAEVAGIVSGAPSRSAAGRTRPEPLIDVPAEAVLESGMGQVGTVGEALRTEVRFLLRDSLGMPMPGVQVAWLVGEGGGRPSSPLTVSDAYGIARAVWTLGPQAGPQSLTARIPGQEDVILIAEARPGPVHQLRISVDTLSLRVGQEHRLTAQGWDEYGNPIEDLDLQWTSSNPRVVSVSEAGVVTSSGKGWGRIRTETRDHLRRTKTGDSTTVVVEADPAALTDLTEGDVGEDWVQLRFTEVDDGTGHAASYAVRWGSPGVAWGDATEVGDGSCASPLEGVAIGAARSCAVTGLEPGTAVDLMVRPFRSKDGGRVYAPEAARIGTSTLERPAEPAGLTIESGVNQVGPVGAPLPQPVIVRVFDAAGGPVAGGSVTFQNPDGGSLSATQVETDGEGRASVQWTLGPSAGSQAVYVSLAAPSGAAAALVEPIAVPAMATAGPAASLTLEPASLSLEVGATGEFTLQATDAFGNPAATAGASWRSNAPSVLAVDAQGRYSALGDGSAGIEVSLGGVSASASATVVGQEPPPVADPERITDLRVVSATSESLVVEYTEVDDGTGNVAQAQIRYAFSPLGWGWGSATVLETGDCRSPITGGSIGSVRRCVIDGLQPGTAYDVQMVAWRAEDSDNVFSALSTIATGTTEAGSVPETPTVARVDVTPARATLTQVGQQIQLIGVAYDAADNVLATPLQWSSSNPSVATVSEAGLVTARGAGTALITVAALCCGEADVSELTVSLSTTPPPPPSSGAWYAPDIESAANIDAVFAIPGMNRFGQAEQTLTTGLQNTPWGGSKALRMNFRSARSSVDQSVGFYIEPPDRATVRPREVWIEVWARYSANWTTEGPEIPAGMDWYSSSHKFLLLHDDTHSSSYRWEDMQGVGGNTTFHQVMLAGGTRGIGNDWMTFEYDGGWHRYRYHARMDETNGRFMLDMDGVRQIGFDGGDTSQGPGNYFNVFQFGANNNRGTPAGQDMWYEMAGVKIYTSNPGWGF